MNRRLVLAGLAGFAVALCACIARADIYGDQQSAQWDQQTPVEITLPQGLTSSTIEVRPGPTPAQKYVIINALRVTNLSRLTPLSVDFKDFVLRNFYGYDDAYHVDAKYTRSLPLSLSEGSLGPGQTTVGAIAFLVPSTMRKASMWYYVYLTDATYPTN